MKKEEIDQDRLIERYLKCEDASESFQLDERKLAGEIIDKKESNLLPLSEARFYLPLAACLAVFFGLVIKNNDSQFNAQTDSNIVASPVASTSKNNLLPEEIAMLDEWLLVSPEAVDFSDVNYDSSYELLVSLETILLP
ncbi:MAG: hypothetical protein VX609_04285 [Verrucomicrobiota bacterium]|nr:hypothetical protein [Verrucomicrobiota bacterium]|tara:strand:+ start:267 stop:683 length:417 start_codon:yes stop_codon:yes gene_type:complete